jgi:3'-phosphoadenosine 5'-phosphosulfate (PAPS) 3'-phosphatase
VAEAVLVEGLRPARLWDTAARGVIATEAGCDAVALDGRPLCYDLAHGLVGPGFLVRAPGGGREACLRALAAARA